MRLEFFIANRIFRHSAGNFSKQMMRIAVLSIALCVVVSFSTIAVINGFKENIFDKVSAFGSHITISAYDKSLSFESNPINIASLQLLNNIAGIQSIDTYIEKAGIINVDGEMSGVVFKGYGPHNNQNFFDQYIISSSYDNNDKWKDNRSIIISKSLADKMKLNTGDLITGFFIMNDGSQPKARRLLVSAVYHTGLEEFDERVIFCDIEKLRKINQWDSTLVSGCEIRMTDKNNIAQTAEYLHQSIDYNLKAEVISDKYPHIFEWLGLQDINAIIIIVLIMTISTITIVSYMLVIIIEKTSFIGLLKAMGMTNFAVRKVFINYILIVSSIGLIIGNLVSITIIWLQKTFKLISLPQETYYISYVPVSINILEIMITNIFIIIIIMAALYIPSMIINKFSPIKAIKID